MPTELADYAVNENTSRGRRFLESPHPYRSDFERDRDRIIHCSAFRRLEGKTQVFTPGLDDYYRTRLTHSIEVAQIGRTIAHALGINETLTEAVYSRTVDADNARSEAARETACRDADILDRLCDAIDTELETHATA